jgi:hypothetical protein
MTDLRNVPLADLQNFVSQIKPELFERTMRATQRAAWLLWRDSPQGMMERFGRGRSKYAFSQRMPSRNRSDGKQHQQAYVTSGAFRASLAKRKPEKTKANGNLISTRFSIFGGVLNVLGAAKQRGFISSAISTTREIVTRGPFNRTINGATRIVKAHQMTLVKTKRTWTRSARTYRDEWEYRPWELEWVQKKSDQLFLERFRKTGLRKNGTLKKNWQAAHPQE